MKKSKTEEKYSVVMHKFIGCSETGLATYEITFNKSLEHTGRFKGIEAGIKRAFETIDLEKEVERSVKNAIERAIKDSSEWGKIRDAVKKKTDEIVETYIEKSISKFRQDFQTE